MVTLRTTVITKFTAHFAQVIITPQHAPARMKIRFVLTAMGSIKQTLETIRADIIRKLVTQKVSDILGKQ